MALPTNNGQKILTITRGFLNIQNTAQGGGVDVGAYSVEKFYQHGILFYLVINDVQSVKSRHQYFRFFGKKLSKSRL